MLSMTGYGKAEYSGEGIALTVEIKTVNNRNFDFNAKTPRAFMAIEDKIRKTVQEYVGRGRTDLFINFTDSREKSAKISVNLERAAQYYAAAEALAKKLGAENDCTVSSVLKFPDVITEESVSDAEEISETVINTVKRACEKLNAMRLAEGEKLIADVLARMEEISRITDKIRARAPKVAAEYREKLKARIEEILAGVEYDEGRLLSETAFYTDKVNIDEELTRLGSHIAQFKKIAATRGSGKKLDFLMQEFNREANTVCSKSNDAEVTALALSLKNEIEKVREQVQNLE